MFSKLCRYTWSDCFILNHGDPEMQDELKWALTRGHLAQHEFDGGDLFLFEQVLNLFECECNKFFMKQWPGCCYMVGQDATLPPKRSSEDSTTCPLASCGR
mmetsp:Transcript_131207/g.419745  ORF Transcript_131207/g.419745 Transcript_131207/m.419745 type:complete len:101 (+) Transcript_131207:254-556(+)